MLGQIPIGSQTFYFSGLVNQLLRGPAWKYWEEPAFLPFKVVVNPHR